jgi:arylsulfatase A-like enzyme
VGSRHRVALLLALALSTACAPRGCAPPQDATEEILLDRIPVADKSWDGVLVEFGSPRALPLLRNGWSYGEVAPDGTAFRWAVSERAWFRFESDREGRELAFLECEPFVYEGSPPQTLSFTVNGVEAPPIELRPGRERYALTLPLLRGENEVELRFGYAVRTGGDKRHLAAAFYRLEIPFSDWKHRIGAYAPVDAGVLLPAEGALSFFLEIPAGARLRLGVDGSEPVDVSIRSETGEIWNERFVVGGAGSAVFERELDRAVGGPFELKVSARGGDVVVRPEIFVPRGVPPKPPPPPRSEPAPPPNIVLVVLDGANALRMGLYGARENTTPVLDAFASKSVVFDVAVTQAVYTVASIGSILTGQYPERHQSVSFADRLRDDVVTFPGILSGNSYRTAAFPGNAVVSRVFGLDRGYDEFYPVWERTDYTGHGDSVVAAFASWLEHTDDDQPFFAYVHFREPHFPYDPPPPFDTRFGPDSPFPEGLTDARDVETLNRDAASGREVAPEALVRVEGLYHGGLAYADALVGEVLELLSKRGLDERTVVIVTADHGEALFEHGFLGHNTQVYEESIRVPLLIRAPGIEPRRVAGVVELIDITPTILDLAGLADDPVLEAMQGRNLVPLLRGEPPDPSRIAFSRTVWAKPRLSARGMRYKLIWNSENGDTELYDLRDDPLEQNDLGGSGTIAEGYLRQALFSWFREQERLKSNAPAPDEAVISEEDQRMLHELGYAEHVPSQKERERKQ